MGGSIPLVPDTLSQTIRRTAFIPHSPSRIPLTYPQGPPRSLPLLLPRHRSTLPRPTRPVLPFGMETVEIPQQFTPLRTLPVAYSRHLVLQALCLV